MEHWAQRSRDGRVLPCRSRSDGLGPGGCSDALVLVTADHETGGLEVLRNNGRGSFPTVSGSTTGHTDARVPVYA
ncbi:MAG: hypothetical protein M3N18_11900 [Actinomycetota bacterium]|nr:hypothetical protein [Actinomycetota bacterium]